MPQASRRDNVPRALAGARAGCGRDAAPVHPVLVAMDALLRRISNRRRSPHIRLDMRMTTVSFTVQVPLHASARRVWAAMVDWESHGRWIPATRSRILEGDGGVGSLFEAVSGIGPLALVDRMRVRELDDAAMRAAVEKVGPVLGGTAGFAVQEGGDGNCVVEWRETVTVPLLPRVLAPLVAAISARAFAFSLRRLQRRLP